MISLTCTNCQALLQMDDAFAGGVCRCQYCGTIQTVPAKAADGAAVARATPTKTLYQKKVRAGATAAGPSSGLDDLAQAVAGSGSGSGLAGSGLGSRRLASPKQPAPASPAPANAPTGSDETGDGQQRRPFPLLPVAIGAALLFLILVGVGIFLLARGHSPVAAGGPTFAGTTLTNATSVIYLLDNGNSDAALFDPLKAVCYKSLATLGPDRKFQVALWDNGVDPITYPADGMRAATPQELDACKKALADATATGNSHLAGPLKQAVAQHPAAIVIATSKWDLDRDDREALAEAQGAGVRLYTFGLGAAPESGDLKLAASASGGQFHHLSDADLSAAGD
jgi:hypothetical protein